MEKRKIVQTLMLLLLLSGFPMLQVVSTPEINDPYTLNIATIGEPETVDPAWAYDTAGLELISNVYDTLICFDRESVDEFVPGLATSYTTDGETYLEFKIREGVEWQNPAYGTLTPRDVEYSFERWIVQDRSDGQTWIILEPLFGVSNLSGLGDLTDPGDVARIGGMIDDSIEASDNNVTFHLSMPYAPFLSIIAQPWASILCEQWCTDHGDFPGFDDTGYTNWIDHHDPPVSPLDDPEPAMMGTGPYKLDYWEKGLEWSIVKFDDYWQGWPAPGYPSCRGYVTRVTEKFVAEWSVRKLMFLAGDADIIHVPRTNINEVFCQPGTRCVYPLLKLTVTNVFFTFDIDPLTPFGNINDYGVFSEDGIPRDFFSNTAVRKAFAYCLDYNTFIMEVFGGEAIHPATAIIPGLLGYDSAVPAYEYNLAEAEALFKSVPGLWETGFTIPILYNTGNLARQTAAEMLKASIEALNPKFHVEVTGVSWSAHYLPAMVRQQLSCFIIGWIADFPDPDNFAVPFYASYGMFAERQGYSNPTMDALINEGTGESDPYERTEIYREIALLAIDDCPSVALYQTLGRHFERDWVCGWYYNAIHPGVYAYHLWKEELPQEDINMDGRVNYFDASLVGQAFGSWYEPGYIHPRWNSRADINCDQRVDELDSAMVESMFGWVAPPWTPPDGSIPPELPDEIVVEDVIIPEELDTDIIAFRLSEPLKPWDVITPSVPQPGHEYVPDPDKTVWFYWINDCPYAGYAHETRYVFIEEETGDYEVFVEEWPPALNGDVLWEDPEEYWDPENWVYSTTNYTQTSIAHEISSSASWTEAKTILARDIESQSAKQALIIEGYDHPGSSSSEPSSFQNASELWYDLFKGFGYSDQEIVYLTPESRQNEYEIDYTCTRQNVATAIQTLTNLNDGDSLIVFIAAHGGVKYWNNLTGYIQLIDGNTLLYDNELTQHLANIANGVHITVIMQSCYCGSFMDNLWTLNNVDTIITSTDWKSVSYMASAGMDPPLVYGGIPGMIQDPNLQDEGGEFSSGLRKGIDDLWQSYIGGSITLGELYAKAYQKGIELDAGYINRETLANKYGNNYKPNPLMKTIFFPGDIDLNFWVNIVDISIVAKAFRSKPGDAEWNPIADMDRNQWVNIIDISTVALYYTVRY